MAALSAKMHDGAITVVDEMAVEGISTRQFAQRLEALGAEGRVLMLLSADEARDEKLYKSGRNLPLLVMREAPHINAREVVLADTIIISQAGLAALSEGVGAHA